MGIYATVADVRAEPEVPDAAPPSDADLEAVIERAEDQIDDWLGPWMIQEAGPSAGRKIVEADVDGWRWTKLQRATVRLAAQLYANPDLLTGAAGETVSGPDFSISKPAPATRRIRDVAGPLNATGLRITGAQAV